MITFHHRTGIGVLSDSCERTRMPPEEAIATLLTVAKRIRAAREFRYRSLAWFRWPHA